MIAKMKPVDQGGSRIAIVFNGSPLFTGAAGSGESEIRRWIIENDWLEAVVALPDNLFYNTGISTYFWIVTNRKSEERRGKVQLVDARDYFVKMRKSLGEKRKEISAEQITEITRLYADFTEGDHVKIFPNEAFGYMRITVERPLRAEWRPHDVAARFAENPGWFDANGISPLEEHAITTVLADLPATIDTQKAAETAIKKKCGGLTNEQVKALAELIKVPADTIVVDAKGNPEVDPNLRDNENVPLPATPVSWEADVTERLATTNYRTAIDTYMTAEVQPYVPDAWVDYDKTKIGYEIPLTRHLYKYVPPRPLAEIDAEIKTLEAEIQDLLREEAE
jgi:type I restriction enzyme M protein